MGAQQIPSVRADKGGLCLRISFLRELGLLNVLALACVSLMRVALELLRKAHLCTVSLRLKHTKVYIQTIKTSLQHEFNLRRCGGH